MEIHTTADASGTRYVVRGEADADNCGELGAALLDGKVAGPVELDLSGLSFLDSSAVSELLRVHGILEADDIALRIVDPSPAVHRVLEITGLLELFGVEPA